MSSAVGPVNEMKLHSLYAVPSRHHNIAGLEIPVAALLMHITQRLQFPVTMDPDTRTSQGLCLCDLVWSLDLYGAPSLAQRTASALSVFHDLGCCSSKHNTTADIKLLR